MSDGGIPDFDEDPTIDTVYSLYRISRADLDPESKAAMEDHFEFGIKDIVQPCGYTESIRDQYYHFYQEKGDFGALIKMLELYPVYGNQEISNELIRLLQKTRLKPVPKRVYDTEQLHKNILFEFEKINPQRGQIDNAYAEIAVTFNINIENVKSVVRRARKNGWVGDFNPFGKDSLNVNKGASSDND